VNLLIWSGFQKAGTVWEKAAKKQPAGALLIYKNNATEENWEGGGRYGEGTSSKCKLKEIVPKR